MRSVCNGVVWFALISGAIFTVAAQVERPETTPPLESSQRGFEGHPTDCPACQLRTGRSLPPEIDDKSVWLKQDGASAIGR